MFLELALETLEERDSIGSRARKPRDDLIVVEAASLARGVLHDVIAHGDLAIGDKHGFILLTHQEHGCAMHPYAFLTKWHSAIIPHGSGDSVTTRFERGKRAGTTSGPLLKSLQLEFVLVDQLAHRHKGEGERAACDH